MTVALRDKRERRAGWYRSMERSFAAENYGFPTDPVLNQAHIADDGSQWELTGTHLWELMSYASMRWAVRKRDGRWCVYRDDNWAFVDCTRSWPDAMRRVAERCAENAGRPTWDVR